MKPTWQEVWKDYGAVPQEILQRVMDHLTSDAGKLALLAWMNAEGLYLDRIDGGEIRPQDLERWNLIFNVDGGRKAVYSFSVTVH